jgi:hypothetical protein
MSLSAKNFSLLVTSGMMNLSYKATCTYVKLFCFFTPEGKLVPSPEEEELYRERFGELP